MRPVRSEEEEEVKEDCEIVDSIKCPKILCENESAHLKSHVQMSPIFQRARLNPTISFFIPPSTTKTSANTRLMETRIKRNQADFYEDLATNIFAAPAERPQSPLVL